MNITFPLRWVREREFVKLPDDEYSQVLELTLVDAKGKVLGGLPSHLFTGSEWADWVVKTLNSAEVLYA